MDWSYISWRDNADVLELLEGRLGLLDLLDEACRFPKVRPGGALRVGGGCAPLPALHPPPWARPPGCAAARRPTSTLSCSPGLPLGRTRLGRPPPRTLSPSTAPARPSRAAAALRACGAPPRPLGWSTMQVSALGTRGRGREGRVLRGVGPVRVCPGCGGWFGILCVQERLQVQGTTHHPTCSAAVPCMPAGAYPCTAVSPAHAMVTLVALLCVPRLPTPRRLCGV